MFEWVCLALLCGVVGFVEWKPGGLHGLYGAVHLIVRPRPPAAAGAESAQHRQAELRREIWLQAAKAFATDADTSAMEMRMTGSLKFIREQAEQGLVAADAEKARHLAAIWSMAACDLDDDPDQIPH